MQVATYMYVYVNFVHYKYTTRLLNLLTDKILASAWQPTEANLSFITICHCW